MNTKELNDTIISMLDKMHAMIPAYMENEEDRNKSNGNVSVCIIDAEGTVYGRMFGQDKTRSRETYKTAWLKASQVWITGIRTGEFERRVFTNEIKEEQFGIRKPDYIGWEGGLPITLNDGTALAIGVSGFTSATDMEMIARCLPK
jgi:uncharacterized protein GlcG (DUF336 family)